MAACHWDERVKSRMIKMQILLKRWCSACCQTRQSGRRESDLQRSRGESRTKLENIKKTKQNNRTNLKVLSVLLCRKTFASRAVAFIRVLDCVEERGCRLNSFFFFLEQSFASDEPFLQRRPSWEEPISGRDTEVESKGVELGEENTSVKNMCTNSQIKGFLFLIYNQQLRLAAWISQVQCQLKQIKTPLPWKWCF